VNADVAPDQHDRTTRLDPGANRQGTKVPRAEALRSSTDAADRLGIDENECGNDETPQRQGVVVEVPSEHGESAVLVQWRLVLGDDLGRKREAGHAARLRAPTEEGLGWAPGGRLLGVPGVEVGLPTVLDGAASAGEPGKEGAGLGGLLFGLVSAYTSKFSRIQVNVPGRVPPHRTEQMADSVTLCVMTVDRRRRKLV
jgi:hypothetical protein